MRRRGMMPWSLAFLRLPRRTIRASLPMTWRLFACVLLNQIPKERRFRFNQSHQSANQEYKPSNSSRENVRRDLNQDLGEVLHVRLRAQQRAGFRFGISTLGDYSALPHAAFVGRIRGVSKRDTCLQSAGAGLWRLR